MAREPRLRPRSPRSPRRPRPPGSDRQLLELAGDLLEDAFDPARPLWTFLVVEGLSGGRGALVSKLHHTITDGVGGIRLSGLWVDRTADDDSPELPAPVVDAPDPEGPRATVAGLLDRQLQATAAAVGVARRTLVDPLATVRDLGVLIQLDRARSPLWRRRGVRRRLEVLSFDLDEVKLAAKRRGGTVNDLFVCALSDAAGAYHRNRCADVGDLRVAMPVSTRTGRTAGGNDFVPTRVLVPCGELTPETRFALVHDRLSRARRAGGLGLFGVAAGAVAVLPPPLVARLARQQAATVDFAASNVRGAPSSCGSREPGSSTTTPWDLRAAPRSTPPSSPRPAPSTSGCAATAPPSSTPPSCATASTRPSQSSSASRRKSRTLGGVAHHDR